MTTQASLCPRCGGAFPAGLEARDFEGICPRCLATLAVDEEVVPSRVSGEDPFKPAAKEPPPLKRGATFHGMEVLEVIGQGGMGVVYKARQIDLDRLVALKILSPRLAADPEFPRRFNREAQALASLDHAHIVRIHDVGREGDLYFLVMEHVEGSNLRDLLVQKKLSPEQALRVVPQLCEALEYAHSRGVIHRDIKPENIILSRSGFAKLADFGLAKIMKDAGSETKITQSNIVMGTADYMAPEQRERDRQADHRADIYSLGVLLYELLTGELPVGRFDPPSRRKPVDGRLDDVVLRALENDPDRRYQRASHLGRDVDRIVASAPAAGPDCAIVDLKSGKQVGLSPARRIGIRTVACPLTVTGWGKPDIGFQVDGDYQFDPDSSTPLLQSQVETRSVTVFVPRGADIDVVAAEGSALVEGVVGHLAARLPEGSLHVTRHEGSLRIHAAQGSVRIDGVKSEYFEVRTRNGSVAISGLDLARGRGQVETENGSVTILPAAPASFRYYLESRHGKVESAPSGQIGSGAGWLTVRSVSGSISLSPPPLAPFSVEGVRDFLRHLTPRQIERLGVFVIVNVALFLFFIFVAGTAIPAAIIAIFWGMALGLELWKGYVHRTNLDGTALSDVVPRVVGRLMKLVPTPTPAPAAAPVPGTALPHVSLLAMLGLGAAILASLSAAAAAITLAVQDGTSGIGFGPREVEELRIAAFATGAAAACLGIIGGVLGVVSSSHLREGTDRLKGRGAAQAAVFLSILSLAVALGHVRPRLWEMRSKVQAARSTADRFVKALCEERFDDAWEMLSDDLRSRVSREDLRKAADGEVRRELRSWEPLNARQAVLSQDGASCRVEGPYSGGYRSAALGLKGSDSWRVHDLREFVAPVAR